ncbi:MAG: hypothetical protein ABR949_00220 [Candidatus Aquilonibacter sp.]|jgi:hypothetical protein
MNVNKKTVRPRLISALTYRKLSERTAVLYGRELDRLNSRKTA